MLLTQYVERQMAVPKWGLFIIPALLAGFLLGGATAKDASLFGQTVAAWVQAIGGIVAIVASAFIAISVDRKAAARAKAERDASDARDYSDGRDAVATARMMVVGIQTQIFRARSMNVPFDRFDLGDWRRRARVASEQLTFHIERGRLAADLAFTAIFVREEISEVQVALKTDSQNFVAQLEVSHVVDAAVQRINDIIEELDTGVLSL